MRKIIQNSRRRVSASMLSRGPGRIESRVEDGGEVDEESLKRSSL